MTKSPRLDQPSSSKQLAVASLALTLISALAAPAHAAPVICGNGITTGCWTKVTLPYPVAPPPAGPANVALLTDGRVLVSGPETTQQWSTLVPASNGSYTSGTFSPVGSSPMGRLFAPSFVLRDGRFLICGGEYVSPGTNRARCDVFDPVTNAWAPAGTIPDMPAPAVIADSPAAMLPDGRYINLSISMTQTWLLTTFNATPAWAQGAAPPSLLSPPIGAGNEGSSLLLQDGTVLFGSYAFSRYLPTTNSWANTATLPAPGGNGYLLNTVSGYEFGPTLLLHSGKALVTGGNTHSAIYTPPASLTGAGSWTYAADTITPAGQLVPFNHGDCPAVVEPDGRVMSIVTNDKNGFCQPTEAPALSEFQEYNPTTNQWTRITTPDTTLTTAGNRARFLALPDGKMLVTGFESGFFWQWTPAGAPQASWRPTVTSLGHPSSKEFVLNGTQLNGLTTGADLGDDAKMATNYPIVSLSDNAGHVYYARTYNVDQLAPRPGVAGSCKFEVPASLPTGTYQVKVAANGVSSASSLSLPYSKDPRVVAARQSTNRTSIFYVKSNGALTTRWVSSTGVWSAETAITSANFLPPGAPLATIKQNPNQLDVFFVGNDGKVYYAFETNDGPWQLAPALSAAKFAVPGAHLATGLQGGTQSDLFVVDVNGTLQGFNQIGIFPWSGAVPLTLNFAPSGASLATGNQGSNQIDVFAIGNSGNVILSFAVGFGGWSLPLTLGAVGIAVPGSGIATGRQGTDQLDVFFTDVNGAVEAAAVVGTGLWFGPVAISAAGLAWPLGELSTSPQATNQLDVFVVNTLGALNQLSVVGTGSWSAPLRLSPDGTAMPGDATSVATQGTNQYDLFLSAKAGLREATTTGTTWSAFAAF